MLKSLIMMSQVEVKKVTLIDPEGLEIEIYYGINEVEPEYQNITKTKYW